MPHIVIFQQLIKEKKNKVIKNIFYFYLYLCVYSILQKKKKKFYSKINTKYYKYIN